MIEVVSVLSSALKKREIYLVVEHMLRGPSKDRVQGLGPS